MCDGFMLLFMSAKVLLQQNMGLSMALLAKSKSVDVWGIFLSFTSLTKPIERRYFPFGVIRANVPLASSLMPAHIFWEHLWKNAC